MDIPEKYKKILPWALGGVVLFLIVVYELKKGSSSAATDASIDPATGVPYAVETAQQGQYASANNESAKIAIAAQAQQDASNIATAQLNASINATQQQNEIQAVTAIGETISKIDSANAIIPATAINAATNQNQAALLAAAQVAAAADSAVPGVIQGAASVLAASNLPYASYGKAVANSGSVQAINSLGSNLAQSEQASAAVSTAATNAAAARTASNNATWSTIGTVAAIALL